MIIDGLSILFILVCAICGIFGQLLRSMIGIYKVYQDNNKTLRSDFDFQRFLISLAIGALIGAFTSLIYNSPLSKTDVISILAASYAGTDWIEGFLTKKSEAI